jgi:hypothetical protein
MDRLGRAWDWLWGHRFIVVGVFLFGLGLAASIWLAFAASSDNPPDGAQSALLVVISGLFNAGGVWAVSQRPGSPNLTASRMAATHLESAADDIADLAALAEEAFERRSPGKSREELGELSWKLSSVETRLRTNVQDWVRAYPGLVDRKQQNPDNEGTRRKDD